MHISKEFQKIAIAIAPYRSNYALNSTQENPQEIFEFISVCPHENRFDHFQVVYIKIAHRSQQMLFPLNCLRLLIQGSISISQCKENPILCVAHKFVRKKSTKKKIKKKAKVFSRSLTLTYLLLLCSCLSFLRA